MNIDAQVVVITPATAREWMEHNTRNRPIRQALVAQYARDMTSGAFGLTGQPIIRNGDGTLLDGQHRLLACVEAGVPFRSLVVTGVSSDVMHMIDAGAKRTFADYLKLTGEKSAPDLAAIARLALMWGEREANGDKSNEVRRRSHSELLGFFERWRDPMRRATSIIVSSSGTPGLRWKRSVIGALVANLLANDCDEGVVVAFVRDTRSGTADKQSPAGMLYERLLRTSLRGGVRMDPWYELALTVKAWNAQAVGAPLGVLRWRTAIEGFPTPLDLDGEPVELIR